MAAAQLTVYGVNYKELRKYGGNRSCVRGMHRRYQRMTLEEFLQQHLLADENDYKAMKLSVRYNKR
jgi:hypothetical protein